MQIKIYIILLFLPLFTFGQKRTNAVIVDRSNYHEITLLGPEINSGLADFAPFQYASKLYYTSTIIDKATNTSVDRVFTSIEKKAPLLIDITPDDMGKSMADVAITNDGNRIYYTIKSSETQSGLKAKSNIYYRDKNYHGRWGAPRMLPRTLIPSKYGSSQPATGIFQESREAVLFFVSDMPGGKGKQDIWATNVHEDGTFGSPFNLPINTPEDEATPFFDNIEQCIFFSSKGHLSLGGFDVLRSKLKPNMEWALPENLGRPINSYFDDLYFTLQKRDSKCYFSSDRPNETCPRMEPACRDFDIYEGKLRVTLKAFIFNQDTNTILEGCNVELVDMQTAAVLHTHLNIESNYISFGLDPDKIYQLIVSKPGYYPIFKAVSPVGVDVFRPLFQEVFLKKM